MTRKLFLQFLLLFAIFFDLGISKRPRTTIPTPKRFNRPLLPRATGMELTPSPTKFISEALLSLINITKSFLKKKTIKLFYSTSKKDKKIQSIGVKSSSKSRIIKELKDFIEDPPSNCRVSVDGNIRTWVVTITGVENSIYAGEEYRLKLVFPVAYPEKPPAVYFLSPVPRHEHVYTNGDICLNLLGRDWQPTMTARGVAVSILSMLSSARTKKLPPDNSMHADSTPGQQQTNWLYHDERC